MTSDEKNYHITLLRQGESTGNAEKRPQGPAGHPRSPNGRVQERPPGKYLVVSHGGTLTMTLYAILGIAPQPNYQGPRFRFRNTAFSRFRYYPASHRWRVDIIGDRAHWKESDE